MKKTGEIEPPFEEEELKHISEENRAAHEIENFDPHDPYRLELINDIVDLKGQLAETQDAKKVASIRHRITILEKKVDDIEHGREHKKAA